jgi:hypothetical protein
VLRSRERRAPTSRPSGTAASTRWAGGADVTTPLEAAAGAIASHVAGRPVSIRCEGDAEWPGLADSNVLGFVSFWSGRGPVDFAELSPDVCRSLQSFAQAPTKPTKCTTVTHVKRTVVKRMRTRVVRTVAYTTVTNPAAPCFANGRELTHDAPFWNSYFYTAEALQTLVHEAVHLKGDPVEAEAECFGMQWVSYAAQQLGDTADDGNAIAQWYATRLYPQRQTEAPDYWSPECKPGGALDLTPADGVFPSGL